MTPPSAVPGPAPQDAIEGEVLVNVRFIGGQIERFVAEDVQKSYEKTARAIAAFIASRPRRT